MKTHEHSWLLLVRVVFIVVMLALVVLGLFSLSG